MVKTLFAPRNPESHKGDFGYVAIIGGCLEYSGAAKLANLALNALVSQPQAALRSGCGVARLCVPDRIAESCLPYLLETTLFPLSSDSRGRILFQEEELEGALAKIAACGVGPGMGQGESHKELLLSLLSRETLKLVLDADALNTLSQMGKEALQKARAQIILTPHMGEFSRLTGLPAETLSTNQAAYAEAYAKETGVILLLKGHTTIVTDGRKTLAVSVGTPGMATAGSGDVLTGILTGLLGRCTLTVETAAAGAWLNGKAGELAAEEYGEACMTAGDTVSKIPEAVQLALGET